MAKKHRGHYCKICGEYKSNESFSGKGHAQHICKECMGEMKKGNKKVLDLPFGDNEFEIVDADEYIASVLYSNSEEREPKTFKKLSREQKMVLKAIVQDEVTLYWQAHRQIPVNDKLKLLRSSVNTVVYEQLGFAIKDDTMFKAYIQEQVVAVINKILRLENNRITNSRKSPFITNGLFLLIIIVLQIIHFYRMNDTLLSNNLTTV